MPPFAVSEPRGPAANVTPCPSEVAQLAERLTVNQNVVGSSPTLGATSQPKYHQGAPRGALSVLGFVPGGGGRGPPLRNPRDLAAASASARGCRWDRRPGSRGEPGRRRRCGGAGTVGLR